MIVDGIIIQSTEHLEEVIALLSEESKISLRLIWEELNN